MYPVVKTYVSNIKTIQFECLLSISMKVKEELRKVSHYFLFLKGYAGDGNGFKLNIYIYNYCNLSNDVHFVMVRVTNTFHFIQMNHVKNIPSILITSNIICLFI